MPFSTGIPLRGVNGTNGTNGKDGLRGTQFIAGQDQPGLELLTIGDFFFRRTTQQLYIKITNAAAACTPDYPNGWQVIATLKGDIGPKGDQGIQGPAGSSLVATSGPPASTLGTTGSFALDAQQAFLYGPKDATNGWDTTNPIHLVGPRGPAGVSTEQAHQLGTFWQPGGNFPTTDAGFARSITAYYGGASDQMDGNVPMLKAGNVRSIYGWVNGYVAGTVTFTLYVNGQATAATATYTGGAGVWEAEFTNNPVTVNKLDYVRMYIRADNSGVDQSFSAFMNLEVTA